MSAYSFAPAERFGVYEAHKGICYWCRAPLLFREATVDHILPETISADALAKAIRDYQLPEGFSLNDYPNWVPSHHSCNSSKSSRLFDMSPAMIKVFDDARRRAPRARALADSVKKDRAQAKVLARIDQARDQGIVTEQEVLSLFRLATGAPHTGPVDVGVSTYMVSDVFTVIRNDFDSYSMAPSGILGPYPGAPSPLMPSSCPQCGSQGQWQGNVCGKCLFVYVAYP